MSEDLDVVEQERLNDTREAHIPWKKWGPYLSERQWGTVREDYSKATPGTIFTHDQARSRASGGARMASKELQHEIWAHGVTAAQASATTVAAMLFLPAVNQMIDITSTRRMATRVHPPPIVFVMLAVMALIGALLAGYHMAGGKARSWLHTVGFAAVIASTVYVILDIEYPRQGLIRVDAADEVLEELRLQMTETP